MRRFLLPLAIFIVLVGFLAVDLRWLGSVWSALWCAHAGQAVRADRPCCVGPAGCFAVLGSALIRPSLRSSATHKGSPSPHRWPGWRNLLQWVGINRLICLPQALCYFYESRLRISDEG